MAAGHTWNAQVSFLPESKMGHEPHSKPLHLPPPQGAELPNLWSWITALRVGSQPDLCRYLVPSLRVMCATSGQVT